MHYYSCVWYAGPHANVAHKHPGCKPLTQQTHLSMLRTYLGGLTIRPTSSL
jgi:hypothetical protein